LAVGSTEGEGSVQFLGGVRAQLNAAVQHITDPLELTSQGVPGYMTVV